MKQASLFLVTIVCLSSSFKAIGNPPKNKNITAEEALIAIHAKLNKLQTISLVYSRELNYASENYHNEMTGNIYLEFNSSDTLTGFKYQFESDDLKEIFNGTEKFDLLKKEKAIVVEPQPQKKSFRPSFFYNSIVTLRNIVPILIADRTIKKEIKDTMIDNQSAWLITLTLYKKTVSYLGSQFDSISLNRQIIYRITVNVKDSLPTSVIQTNDANNDFTATKFADIKINPVQPNELSWFYSTYTNEYKKKQQDTLQLVATGINAGNWTLPLYNNNAELSLADLKGKVILLDFWIKNCGPCIESVPYLNSLEEKFKNKNVAFLSINAYDSKRDISWFCNKHNVDYKVLINGKEIAKKYGITAFPTFLIIDKQGTIAYANEGLDKLRIEAIINALL